MYAPAHKRHDALFAATQGLRLSRPTLAVVVAAHATLFAVLWQRPAEPDLITPPRPLMVSLIQPERELEPEPPKPGPIEPRPTLKPSPPPPMLATRPTPTPTPVPPVEAPRPDPVAVSEVPSPPAPRPVVEAPQAAAPPTPPRPADYLSNPKPPYPGLSKKLNEEGTVRIRVWVEADGTPGRLEIASSSGFARLDNAALAVLPKWRFIPARQGGKPVADWAIVPMEFKLNRG